jgi:hypothetical protein
MRKDKVIQESKTEYFCDICNKQIEGYLARGSPVYPEELLSVCERCGKEVCSQCSRTLSSVEFTLNNTLCKDCYELNKSIIDQIEKNINIFRKENSRLLLELFKK